MTHYRPLIFDKTCAEWEDKKENNIFFIRNIQLWLNTKLRCYGSVALNDALLALGYNARDDGDSICWNSDKGDYVDLGLYLPINHDALDLNNSEVNTFFIVPNIGGYMYDFLEIYQDEENQKEIERAIDEIIQEE